MDKTLLISNCSLLAEAGSTLLTNQFVLIRDGIVSQTGSGLPENPPVSRIDADNKLVMPGLVNGHNHCGMSFFRGMADDLPLKSWLYETIFPAEKAHIDPEIVYWCTKLAAAEMILSGTTTVADCYLFSPSAAQALCDAGMRSVVAHGIIDFPTVSVPDPLKNIEATATFIKRWLNRSELLTPAVFAHAPYTCSPQTLSQAKQLADHYNLQFFIHLAETQNEQAQILDPQGSTPVEHLLNLGILDPNTTCIHAVWVNQDDIELLAESGTRVITCPQSNAKLGAGIAPVSAMLSHNITVGLGTDSCASNNSLDMYREMDILAKLQKYRGASPTAMTAKDVLACATAHGAAAIGGVETGIVKPGFYGDLVIINSDAPNLCPLYNPDLLVYAASGSNVETVIVHGEIVMQDRQLYTIDLEEVYHEIERRIPR